MTTRGGISLGQVIKLVRSGWVKCKYRWSSIMVVLLLTKVLTPGWVLLDRPIVSGRGIVSIEARLTLAAQLGGTTGLGEVLPAQVEVLVGRGGPPIKSVVYNFNAVLDTDPILIIDNDGLPDVSVGKGRAKAKAKGAQTETKEEVATRIRDEDVQPAYEVWTLLSSFLVDDPVRNGILLDNERIVRFQGKDYLVITLAYFDIYIYSLDPLRFTTRINGLDAGPVMGVWW